MKEWPDWASQDQLSIEPSRFPACNASTGYHCSRIQQQLSARIHGWRSTFPFHQLLWWVMAGASRMYHKPNWEPLEKLLCGTWSDLLFGETEIMSDWELFLGMPSPQVLLHPVFDTWRARGWLNGSGLRELMQKIFKPAPWVTQKANELMETQTSCGARHHDIGIHVRLHPMHWPQENKEDPENSPAVAFGSCVQGLDLDCIRWKNCSIYIASEHHPSILLLAELLRRNSNHQVCHLHDDHGGEHDNKSITSPTTNDPGLVGMLEFIILSQTKYLVGTRYSTFDMMAVAAGRTTSHTLVAPVKRVVEDCMHGQRDACLHGWQSPFASQSLSRTHQPHVRDGVFTMEALNQISCMNPSIYQTNIELFGGMREYSSPPESCRDPENVN